MSVKSESFQELETVVLVHDIPEAGLKAGDLGAIVQIYSPEAFEVEFVTAAGGIQALSRSRLLTFEQYEKMIFWLFDQLLQLGVRLKT